ncbi:MAG: RHS repeat-associated core domain-containing protein, partial [Paludibacteraceae bacterium]|nr:RHS repeat-associated core domain-containing protein [Paludibacteraceae bacterium]
TDPQGVTTKYHYLPGGAVMIEKGGERNLYYNYTDRLGSVVATTDADGNVVEKYAYDPWGARLNPENWTEQDTRTDLLNNRGFTGHEHIDGMSLIDMNGRVYDPLIGSFLSVDPFIQAPDNWLNYNRYMYCFGNPLKYTDPSGHIGVFVAIGIGAAIGAVLGTGAGLWYGYNKGYSGWNLAKSALIGAGIGAGVGAVSGYFIGSSISSVMASKTLWNFTQAGASIGETVGLVGGSVYGLAKKADGWELANYAGLGAGIGLVAGAAIGAGCYGIYSYGGVVANSANDVTRLSNAKTVAINEADEAYDYFYNSMKKDAKAIRPISPEKFLAAKEVQRQTLVNVDVASMNLANARSVASNVRIWANVGYAALTGVGTVGAGFGYHYLSNFLFDYIPSHLYGN